MDIVYKLDFCEYWKRTCNIDILFYISLCFNFTNIKICRYEFCVSVYLFVLFFMYVFNATLEHISTRGCRIQACARRLWALSREGFLSSRAIPAVTLDRPIWSPWMIILTYFNPIKSHLRTRIFKTITRFFGIKLTCYRCNNFETKYVVNDFPSIVLLSKQYDAFFMTSCRYEDCDYCRKNV